MRAHLHASSGESKSAGLSSLKRIRRVSHPGTSLIWGAHDTKVALTFAVTYGRLFSCSLVVLIIVSISELKIQKVDNRMFRVAG
jgi:hypothetical protein